MSNDGTNQKGPASLRRTGANTRRGILGALVSIPLATSFAATPAAAATSALVAAASILKELRTALDRSGDEEDRLFEERTRLWPPRPDGLRVSDAGSAFIGVGFSSEKTLKGGWIHFYGSKEIETLRTQPRLKEIRTPIDEMNVRVRYVPDEAMQREADELVALHDAWEAEKDAVSERIGLAAVSEFREELWEKFDTELARALQIPASSLSDLQIKARLLLENNHIEQPHIDSFLAEITAFVAPA